MTTTTVAKTVLVALCLLAAVATAAYPNDLQQKHCHSDSDCIQLFTETGSHLRLDALDLDADTPAKLDKLIPSWFGPARPVQYQLEDGSLLKDDVILRQQGVKLLTKITMVKKADEL